ncbi:metal-sulfur cluster assembly factor [Mesorhizobium atlanticum]
MERNCSWTTRRSRKRFDFVIDPELGYNIVDLGLVYAVLVNDGGVVNIVMSTTTRGCPATNYLTEGARDAAWSVPGVEFVDVTLTYEPSLVATEDDRGRQGASWHFRRR